MTGIGITLGAIFALSLRAFLRVSPRKSALKRQRARLRQSLLNRQ